MDNVRLRIKAAGFPWANLVRPMRPHVDELRSDTYDVYS